MAQPTINIAFHEAAITAIARSEKGVGLVFVRGAAAAGKMTVTSRNSEIPASLSAENAAYAKRAYIGYVNAPRQVLIYEMGTGETVLQALAAADLYDWDYAVLPPDVSAEECSEAVAWVKSARDNDHRKYKLILPDTAADCYGVINFTATGIDIGTSETLDAADYCPRIMGVICGTPMNISATYAPLPEVVDITRLTRADADKAEEAGKLCLLHDGSKVKLGRAVNSFVTPTADHGESFRKIKIVEIIDMIQTDLRRACEDNYIGKYANTYDNKCLLLTAISGYLMELEQAELVQPGWTVEIDVAAQAAWLTKHGVNTAAMTDEEIRQADTGSYVFIKVFTKILDSIEDIDIDVTI